MTDRGDTSGDGGRDRAVTVQIGAVILFGFLIVALSTYQAAVVPDQNREVEFLHNQEVQTDIIELSSSVAAAGRTGSSTPQTVQLGTRYPSRALFVNPPPASGRLTTDLSAANVSLSNVTVLRPDGTVDDEAADYWNGTVEYETAFVVYEPRYNQYRDAPTTRSESGVVFNRFPSNATLSLTDQRLIDGDRVTLVVVTGNLSAGGVDAASVDPSAVSVVTRRERIAGGANITVPSTRNASVWAGEELLNVAGNPAVDAVTDVPGEEAVRIELNDTRSTSLGVAVVNVGDRSDEVVEPEPAYLTIEQAPTTVSNGTTREVVVEVRDRYGNPVDAVDVTATTNGSGAFAAGTLATGEDGRATFEYTPGATGDEELQFEVSDGDAFDAATPLDANATVTVNEGSAGAGDGGADDPNPPDSVVLVDSYRKQSDGNIAVLELENRGATTVNSTEVRVNFFAATGGNNPTEAVLTTAAESPTLDIGGGYRNASIAFPPNTTKFVCYEFDETLDQDEFFISTYEFSDGNSEQYFVGLNTQRTATCDGPSGGGGGGGGGAGASPGVSFRLDDLSHADQSRVAYVGSYAVTNTNASFERVEIAYENTADGSASQTLQKAGTRGGLTYTNSFGAGDNYDVTVRVIYADGAGGEYVAASKTVGDVADAANPSGNDDVSTASSASLSSSTIEDRSNNGNGPRYRFDYTVSAGDYGETELVVVSTGSGGKQSVTLTARSVTNEELNPTYGFNEPFKVAILVYGPDGAVVDARIVTDTADGTGP